MTFQDFLCYSKDTEYETVYNPIFQEIFQEQYELSGLTQDYTYIEYMDGLLKAGEFNHEMYKPVQEFLSAGLDIITFGAKPLIEAFVGEDLITGEQMTETERYLRAIEGIVGLVSFGSIWSKLGKIGIEGVTAELAIEVMSDTSSTITSTSMNELGANGIVSTVAGIIAGGITGSSINNAINTRVWSSHIETPEVPETPFQIQRETIQVEEIRFGGEGRLNSYADFSKAVNDIGKRTDLTDSQKIKELQNLFEKSSYKTDINVPSDIQYVKSFDTRGNVIYDWPPKLGFDESTITPISRVDGLPDTWDRYGYMGGSNFADVPSTGKYTYSERSIPYIENEAAYHIGTFNNASYFDKIDAIKNGDMDTFNELLQKEGIPKWKLDDFEELCDSYNLFISEATKELGDSVDVTYGIKGIAAEWGDMSGGAVQIVTPFGGDVLEKIGILKEN